MKRTAVIMAGGSGERFWPLSRIRKPKQLLPLTGNRTMIEEAIDRITPLIKPEDIFIITGELLLEPIREALPKLPPENIIAEPLKRNTAPCLALAAAFVKAKYAGKYEPDQISMAVLTADHIIKPESDFRDNIAAILDYVETNPKIAVIGVPPIRPETGYGYIELEETYNITANEVSIKDVVRFREKPEREQAEKFVVEGKYLWNSGMFFWRVDTFINEMEKHLPEIGLKINEMAKLYKGWTNKSLPGSFDQIKPVFESFPNISIDYGLMEKSGNIIVAKAIFEWDDIGSFDSLDRVRQADEDGNIVTGNVTMIDCRNSNVLNHSSINNIKFTALGMEGIVAVITDDAILVCPKDRVQEVKKLVEKIRNDGDGEWL
jgi:mannose-1-phosphate guanylyltransferase